MQGLLEDALATVLREPVRLSVAGRTDAGVHAWAQVASFSCARHGIAPERLRLSLNSLLPPDIAVLQGGAGAARLRGARGGGRGATATTCGRRR